MGMQNSAQAFQRLVDSVIGDLEGTFTYLDDILIYAKSEAEHMKILEELFSRLSRAGLSIALGKCEFGVQALDYLGYRVDASGLAPLPRKTEALRNFPRPTKQKELLAFLGAINYYRASLPKLEPSESSNPSRHEDARAPSQVLDPLYKLATCKLSKKNGESFHEHDNMIALY